MLMLRSPLQALASSRLGIVPRHPVVVTMPQYVIEVRVYGTADTYQVTRVIPHTDREAALAEHAELVKRHPRAFGPHTRCRLVVIHIGGRR